MSLRKLARLGVLLSLAGCMTAADRPAAPPAATRSTPGAAPRVAPGAAAAPDDGICRIGPDDGPDERPVLAERGIGGTGIRPEDGDRGIGGTGIVGVVTGFASICVNGLEIGYDPALPVDLDGARGQPGQPGHPGQLRAGQLVVIEASGTTGSLRARSLSLRHEVSGPVEQRRGTEGLRVAGQEIRFTPDTRGGTDWKPGDWIAVSGLRRPDGRIMASRIDRRDPGRILVRGVVEPDDAGMRIGALRFTPPTPLRPGVAVTVTGRLEQGVFIAESARTDLLQADPARAFGPGIDRLVIESYFSLSGGMVRLGGTSFGIAPRSFGARRAVIDARRGGDQGFIATEMRGPGDRPGSRPGERPGSRGDFRGPAGAASRPAGGFDPRGGPGQGNRPAEGLRPDQAPRGAPRGDAPGR